MPATPPDPVKASWPVVLEGVMPAMTGVPVASAERVPVAMEGCGVTFTQGNGHASLNLEGQISLFRLGANSTFRRDNTEMSLAVHSEWRYSSFMMADDVRAPTVERKIQIMEAIWEDFRERFERSEISPQQKQLLDRRRARVCEGAARLLDWGTVKGTLGRP